MGQLLRPPSARVRRENPGRCAADAAGRRARGLREARMTRLLGALRRHAAGTPSHVALEDAHGALTYGELLTLVEQLAQRLRDARVSVIGLLADNGRGWVLADLAAHVARVPVVPLPTFFTPAQLGHNVGAAVLDCVLTDDAAAVESALNGVS